MTGTLTSKFANFKGFRGTYTKISMLANLLRLNFGSGDELQYPDNEGNEDEEESSSGRDNSEQCCWHRSEHDDFCQLGTMFAEFVLMKPFTSDPKVFSTFVADPIFEPEGPFLGDTRVLSQVMASIMVHHRYVL